MNRIYSIVLEALGWSYYFLPLSARVKLGKLLGRLFFFLGLRKKIIRSNLHRAFPKGGGPSLKEVYEHLGLLGTEMLYLGGPLKAYASKTVRIEGVENIHEALSKGRGVICVAGHLGNWEITATSGLFVGFRSMMFTKKLKPQWLHEKIESARLHAGCKGTYEPRTLPDGIKHLKNGGVLGIVIDQYMGPPVGVPIKFFGTIVGTSGVVARLAGHYEVPVVPVYSRRHGNGHWTVHFGPAFSWIPDVDTQTAVIRNTQQYVSYFEERIRECPEQWLWSHRRFKGVLDNGNDVT